MTLVCAIFLNSVVNCFCISEEKSIRLLKWLLSLKEKKKRKKHMLRLIQRILSSMKAFICKVFFWWPETQLNLLSDISSLNANESVSLVVDVYSRNWRSANGRLFFETKTKRQLFQLPFFGLFCLRAAGWLCHRTEQTTPTERNHTRMVHFISWSINRHCYGQSFACPNSSVKPTNPSKFPLW